MDSSVTASPPAEPQAEQRPLERTLHDLRLIDEYAWLKAENWREVMRDPFQLDPAIRAYLPSRVGAFSLLAVVGCAEAQAVFFRRRHQPRRPPLAKIRPGRPAPAMGPGTEAKGGATRQKLPEISPIFISDKVRLHVSREKDGKSGLLYAQIGRFQNRPASRGACASVTRRYV
jgi:hypothetical protein